MTTKIKLYISSALAALALLSALTAAASAGSASDRVPALTPRKTDMFSVSTTGMLPCITPASIKSRRW